MVSPFKNPPQMFKVDMRKFFVDRPAITGAIEPKVLRAFGKLGFAIMRFARDKVLKPARQKKVSELSAEERDRWEYWKDRFKRGLVHVKPRRPDTTAKPGNPPQLHAPWWTKDRRKSPLRKALYYGVDPKTRSLVVGPEVTQGVYGLNVPERLERGNHQFMSVALEEKLPTLQQLLKG